MCFCGNLNVLVVVSKVETRGILNVKAPDIFLELALKMQKYTFASVFIFCLTEVELGLQLLELWALSTPKNAFVSGAPDHAGKFTAFISPDLVPGWLNKFFGG